MLKRLLQLSGAHGLQMVHSAGIGTRVSAWPSATDSPSGCASGKHYAHVCELSQSRHLLDRLWASPSAANCWRYAADPRASCFQTDKQSPAKPAKWGQPSDGGRVSLAGKPRQGCVNGDPDAGCADTRLAPNLAAARGPYEDDATCDTHRNAGAGMCKLSSTDSSSILTGQTGAYMYMR